MVELGDLVRFAKAYSNLGWAVQDQFEKILTDPGYAANPNAVSLMRSLIDPAYDIDFDTGEELEQVISEWEAVNA